MVYKMTRIKVQINNPNTILNRILDDDVGRYTAETWGKIFEKYVPMDSGTLSQDYITEPWKITYKQVYSHYQWKGVSKSGHPLNYNKEKHPLATKEWEKVAERNKKSEVARAITEYIRRK